MVWCLSSISEAKRSHPSRYFVHLYRGYHICSFVIFNNAQPSVLCTMPFQKELLDTMLLQYVVVVRMKKEKPVGQSIGSQHHRQQCADSVDVEGRL